MHYTDSSVLVAAIGSLIVLATLIGWAGFAVGRRYGRHATNRFILDTLRNS